MHDVSPIGMVAAAAREAGLPVEMMSFTKRLRVGGEMCAVAVARSKSDNGYYCARITIPRMTKYRFLIVLVAPGRPKCRILVIPTSVLRERFPLNGHRAFIFIPTKKRKPGSTRNRPRVDWRMYVNAWHLLAA